jgi:copper chaperone CopZ
METLTYPVKGMTCGGCVRHVEKALRATPGVAEAQVDLAAGTARVVGTASPRTLAEAVAEAGYELVLPT